MGALVHMHMNGRDEALSAIGSILDGLVAPLKVRISLLESEKVE
jgi:hypothetical protein